MRLEVSARIARPGGFVLDLGEACDADAIGVVGGSGAGKSTLLHALAGFERATVKVDGHDWSRLRAEQRQVGYVLQDALLFPHLDVRGNLLHSPRAAALGDIPEALGIAPLLDRMPRNLSGGERRRVALARAILSRPRLLLLDEPFAGLDEARRREAMSLLDHVRRSLGIPMVLVSHAADEIIGLTDWAIRLEAGRVVGHGPALSILREGEIRFDNYVTGSVVAPGRVRIGSAELHLPLPDSARGLVRLACYAHDIIIGKERPHGISARNVIPTTVQGLREAGGAVIAELQDPPLRAVLTPESVQALELVAGSEVYAILKATSLSYLGRA